MKAAGDKGKCIRCNEHTLCEFGWCCVQGGGELAGARRGVYGGGHGGGPTFVYQCYSCSSRAFEWKNVCTMLSFVVGPGMLRDGTTKFRDSHGAFCCSSSSVLWFVFFAFLLIYVYFLRGT